ncbi:MAG: hypothetical protein EBU46_16730, partial [Nitrosomonadaceae bacterium]|nr:hypothetical protein [Nitrosomonadaceae bacterium]
MRPYFFEVCAPPRRAANLKYSSNPNKMEEITSLDELVEERTATFGFEVINDCGASTKASSEFGAGPQASALFTFDLPRVP